MTIIFENECLVFDSVPVMSRGETLPVDVPFDAEQAFMSLLGPREEDQVSDDTNPILVMDQHGQCHIKLTDTCGCTWCCPIHHLKAWKTRLHRCS